MNSNTFTSVLKQAKVLVAKELQKSLKAELHPSTWIPQVQIMRTGSACLGLSLVDTTSADHTICRSCTAAFGVLGEPLEMNCRKLPVYVSTGHVTTSMDLLEKQH
jgi:hypothetical protein